MICVFNNWERSLNYSRESQGNILIFTTEYRQMHRRIDVVKVNESVLEWPHLMMWIHYEGTY